MLLRDGVADGGNYLTVRHMILAVALTHANIDCANALVGTGLLDPWARYGALTSGLHFASINYSRYCKYW